MIEALVSGFLVSLSLIAAIGAQNAFVLRQGIRREHVGWVVLVCAASDAVLMTAGIAGFGAVSARVPWLGDAMLWAGVAFLLIYGAMRFRAAWQGGEALRPTGQAPASLSKVLSVCLLLTWANPHVYLDTLVLIGAISAQYAPYAAVFGVGAVAASACFFTALGFGARLLAPVMARPRAWVVLEVLVGATMWAIAAALAFGA
ncbi:LysE/ArgO family amino acid transporter [Pseudorhodobacter sp.]|uniref:LysE/ArgO family amino acid transporter n=1 Tax=Pseudorhodobacter sp. TaxID=1934400 RepID=UPI0026489AF1|nr:LysE/ArgO family amino acid transporter [Pseudorhodobacter sp.]MDN5787103.1 LysE/ArgO family amino acid transporter [Pseudorhodobacter sp.]